MASGGYPFPDPTKVYEIKQVDLFFIGYDNKKTLQFVKGFFFYFLI